MITQSEFRTQWSALHGSADTSGIVGGWLAISYRFGLICTLLRITPNALTLFGLLAAIGTALTATSAWAIALIAISLFFDGIDGSVAIFQKRESNFGAVLDSVVDRISEALWCVALYRVGVPAWAALAIWTIAAIQEYARARIISLGISKIGIVTFTERPVRASFIFIILIAYQFNLTGFTVAAIIFAAIQLVSAGQVLRYGYSQLR
jgi:archaetidylinositol phosphate synthase